MTLKQRNILLFIGFGLLLFICYKIPVKKTLSLKKEYEVSLLQNQLLSEIPQKIALLKREEIYLDSILSKYKLSTDKSFQSNLLQTITDFSAEHKLTISGFDEPHSFTKNDIQLNSFSFSVIGDFKNALMLVHELEQVKKLGKLISVKFEKNKNYKTNKNYLESTILLQRIKN